jgi:L-Ala-D/L-Glu epimerase
VTLSGSETTFPPPAVDARRAEVRITALEAIPFAVPYRRPAGFASGTVTTADNVLVRVHTDAGLVGQAEAQPRPYTYGETQASIVLTVRAAL